MIEYMICAVLILGAKLRHNLSIPKSQRFITVKTCLQRSVNIIFLYSWSVRGVIVLCKAQSYHFMSYPLALLSFTP